MIACALLAVVGLGVSTLMSNWSQASRNAAAKGAVTGLFSSIQKRIQSMTKGLCLDPSVGCVATPWLAEANGGVRLVQGEYAAAGSAVLTQYTVRLINNCEGIPANEPIAAAPITGGRMALCRACPAGQRPYVSMTSTRPGVPVVRFPAVNEARTMGATACVSFAPGNQLVVDVIVGFVDGAANSEANLNFRIQERRFTFPLSRSTLMRVR